MSSPRTLAENAQRPHQRQDDRPPGCVRSNLPPRRRGAEWPGPLLLRHVKEETLVNLFDLVSEVEAFPKRFVNSLHLLFSLDNNKKELN